jgi:hypothetical protein
MKNLLCTAQKYCILNQKLLIFFRHYLYNYVEYYRCNKFFNVFENFKRTAVHFEPAARCDQRRYSPEPVVIDTIVKWVLKKVLSINANFFSGDN